MIIVMNDAFAPVSTTVNFGGINSPIIIPGKGWRKVLEAERTENLNTKITDGILRIYREIPE